MPSVSVESIQWLAHSAPNLETRFGWHFFPFRGALLVGFIPAAAGPGCVYLVSCLSYALSTSPMQFPVPDSVIEALREPKNKETIRIWKRSREGLLVIRTGELVTFRGTGLDRCSLYAASRPLHHEPMQRGKLGNKVISVDGSDSRPYTLAFSFALA